MVSAAPPVTWSVAIAVAALILYALIAPGVSGDKDASEFALVLATLGVAHPTGYPLYTLSGWAFVHLLHLFGVGLDQAANLWSGVGGAVALGLTHALAARLLARQGVAPRAAAAAALLPAVALATNPAWVDEATLAEVNTWHGAWTAGAALFLVTAILAMRRRDHDAGVAPLTRLAAAWGLIVGLGAAHHATSLLTAAPFTVALIVVAARAGCWRWRFVPVAAGFALLPLTSYAWIAWHAFHPAEVQWATLAPDWKSVLDHITGAAYRVYLGSFAPIPQQRRLLASAVYPWLVPGLALLAWWALRARRAPGALRGAVAAAVVIGLGYVFSYGVPDPSSYFLPPLLLTLAVAPAAVLALPGVATIGRPLAWVAAAGLAIACVTCVTSGLRRASGYRAQDRALDAMWTSVPFDRGLVVWNDDMSIHLRGYQLMRGQKPDLEIVRPVKLTHDWPRKEFTDRHGFDPVSRADVDSVARVRPPRDVQALGRLLGDVITARINRLSPLPVAVFDPRAGKVRVLPKPLADTTAAGVSSAGR